MFLKFNKFTLIWALVIVILTQITGVKNSNIETSATDKLAHVFMFAALCLSMIIGFSKQNDSIYLKFNAEKSSILICIFFGFLMELLQLLVPCRSFSWYDVLANSVGSALGVGVFYVIYKFKKA
jgi:VanZ family protein